MLLTVTNSPDAMAPVAERSIMPLDAHVAAAVTAAVPADVHGTGMANLVRQVSGELVSQKMTLEDLHGTLDRAERLDFWISFLEGVFKDGLPGVAVTLAMNLAGTNALAARTNSDMAVAASYGAIVGASSVMLGHLVREWFTQLRYTAWPEPQDHACTDVCKPDWKPEGIATLPYLAAVAGPATVRNIVRAITACALAGAGRRDLTASIDNIIENAGGVIANAGTAVLLASMRRHNGADARGHLLLHKNLRAQLFRLQASFVASLVKDSATVARRALANAPGALRALITPVGLAQMGVLVSGVMITTLATGAVDDSMPDDSSGAREAAMGTTRAALLALVYAGLGMAAISADKAARLLVLGVRNLRDQIAPPIPGVP